jgi:hypothetical protein
MKCVKQKIKGTYATRKDDKQKREITERKDKIVRERMKFLNCKSFQLCFSLQLVSEHK